MELINQNSIILDGVNNIYRNTTVQELGFEYDNFGNNLNFNTGVNFNNNSTFNNRVSINDVLEGNNNTLTIDADIINNQFLQAENQELTETIEDNYNQIIPNTVYNTFHILKIHNLFYFEILNSFSLFH